MKYSFIHIEEIWENILEYYSEVVKKFNKVLGGKDPRLKEVPKEIETN